MRGNELRVLLVVGAALVVEAAIAVLIGAVAPETGPAGGAAALLRNVLVAPLLGVATVVVSLELTRAPV